MSRKGPNSIRIPQDDAKAQLARLQGTAKRLLRMNKLWLCKNPLCKHSHPNEPLKGRHLERGQHGRIRCPRCGSDRLAAVQSPRTSALHEVADRVRRITDSVAKSAGAGSQAIYRFEDGWTMDLAPPVK